MTKERKARHNKLLTILTITVYLALAVTFLAYFVILNNSKLIIYSFAVFFLLGILISAKERLITYTAILAAAVISTVFISYSNSGLNSLLSYVSSGLGILGYYLLISAILALFLRLIYKNNGLYKIKIIRVFRHYIVHNKNAITILTLVIGVVLLLLPIYPMGVTVPLSNQPYIPISLFGMHKTNVSTNSTLYAMSINISSYKDLFNPSASNMRIYYTNNTLIKAYLVAPGLYSEDTIKLILDLNNNIGNYTNIMMYIMPYNTSYGRAFERIGSESAAGPIAGHINASVGKLENAGKYANASVQYVGKSIVKHAKQINYVMAPYYIWYSLCGINVYVNTSANNTISIFAVHNLTSIPNIGYNGSNGQVYAHYITKLSNISYFDSINTTSSQTLLSNYNNECTSYVVVADKRTRLNIYTNSSFYTDISYNVTEYIPVSITKRPTYSYSFLPQSLAYLDSYYTNETEPINVT
jgi:hypothetical protein